MNIAQRDSNTNLDYQADMLVRKTKHYLITTMGKTIEEANPEELYRTLSFAFREEIMANWLATSKTMLKKDTRMLYYLSMEYLPGKTFLNNAINSSSIDIVKLAANKMQRNLTDLMACESDPGLGNGGLGRLASCFLDSLATHHYPAQAYGLRYQYGIFEQYLKSGVQYEAPDCWLISENPWEFRRDMRKVIVNFCGWLQPATNSNGDEIFDLQDHEDVWAVPYDLPCVGYGKNGNFSVITLRLWTVKESPHNFQLQSYNAGRLDQASENTALTDVLYPSDHHETGKRIRLKQEFLLVSASLQDIIRHYLTNHDDLKDFGDKVRIQINDTHPALVIPELIVLLTEQYDMPWSKALEITEACTSYTNHTVLREALEEWDQSIMNYLLPRQYKVIERLNMSLCNQIRARYGNDEEKVRRMSILEQGKVRMANLAMLSHCVNGVAELHTDILKKTIFKDFYDLWPEKFVNITNGVTQRRWLLLCNPELSQFITSRIGDEWITDFMHIHKLANFADDPLSQQEFLDIKRRNKKNLLHYLNGHSTIPREILLSVDIESIFDVQIKRVHEYKRQLMNALNAIMLYQEILEEKAPTRIKRTVIFAGKAAAGYEMAKDIIRLIYCISRKINKDPHVSQYLKVLYVENYNITKAEHIIPAADLSQQISTAGMEASGTGNMKLSMNGALTIATDDGANIEMKQAIDEKWWPFVFGASAEEIADLKASHKYSPWDVCSSNARIRRAVDSLRDRTFAVNEIEHRILSDLYHKLLEGHYGAPPDRYFTLHDLDSYYQMQKNVEELYLDPLKWSQFAIHNIAGMGKFSSDYSIKEYAEKVWHLDPCPLDPEILENVRSEYRELDQCRIYAPKTS